jgi:putative tryptophan/tyrosine transport system substrate-binding protein
MTTRRQFALAVLGAAIFARVDAQPRPRRVGMLVALPRDKSIVAPILIRALADIGYREGKEITLEYRAGADVRAAAPAQELSALNCDLIFAFEELAVRTLRERAPHIPVVFFAADFDPIERGMVKNPRKPEANVTGVYGPIGALSAKKLELAQEILPGAKRFLVFSDVHSRDQLRALRSAAQARSAELTVIEYTQPPYDLAAGFETGRKAGVDAFLGLSSPHLAAKRAELGNLFIKYKIPAIASRLSYTEPGFLVGYTFNLAKALGRTAQIGARILEGAKPADIPVEEAHEFELILNLKTAKNLGVTIPYTVMARATKIIE